MDDGKRNCPPAHSTPTTIKRARVSLLHLLPFIHQRTLTLLTRHAHQHTSNKSSTFPLHRNIIILALFLAWEALLPIGVSA